MHTPYYVLANPAEGEITEKKSRFIAHLIYAQSEEEAENYIASTKKTFWDARHNCWAYSVSGDRKILRCSDDGEPSGTAGRPMLQVIEGRNLHQVCAVVTRYFGGVLLGTGGLVRAYQDAMQEALSHAKLQLVRYGYPLEIETDYNEIGKLLNLMAQESVSDQNVSYTDKVRMSVISPEEDKDRLVKAVTELTGGRARIEIGDGLMYRERK